MMQKCFVACFVTGLFLSGCKQGNEQAQQTDSTASIAPAVSNPSPPQASVSEKAFALGSVPFSTVALGSFPYVTLPAGYTNQGYGKTEKNFARFPFVINGQSHWVEGQFYGTIFSAEEGKQFSAFEVRKNFDALVEQMGGAKVSESKLPIDDINKWGDEITQGFIDGLGDVYNNPISTYLIRRKDGNIWLHLVTDSAGGAFIVGREKSFEQTAQLLPASELKKRIDSEGKVALQVNFATGKTNILPASQPQIAQVTELLKQDPELKLAVNGHTDNTGDEAHNQTLSLGRAQAVMAALTAQGVDASRLSAQGFGDSQPVASNDSEQGKAQNRRVELVKQ